MKKSELPEVIIFLAVRENKILYNSARYKRECIDLAYETVNVLVTNFNGKFASCPKDFLDDGKSIRD